MCPSTSPTSPFGWDADGGIHSYADVYGYNKTLVEMIGAVARRPGGPAAYRPKPWRRVR